MSFFGNLIDSAVSFATESVRTIEKEVVNPTVSFATDSARAIEKEVVNPTVTFATDSARTIEKEVVNPTVTFATNSARAIEEEVVNPTVTFATDSARTIEKEVIDPVVSYVERQIQWKRELDQQEQILKNLQESEGSHFLGDDYNLPDRKNWMSHLSVDKLTLNKIVWPGTHDSATNNIGDPVFTNWLGECQTLSIYEQLVLGTRVLDIRVQKDRRVCHGALTSYNIDVVLYDVIRFLSETQSEIIILEIRTEFGKEDPPEFHTYLVDKLGPFLIHQDDTLFNKSVSEILPKRVICFWKPREHPRPGCGGLLWNSDYLKDNWIDTNLPWTKFQSNMDYLKKQPPLSSRNFFYRIENTVTPQLDNLDLSVRPVTDRIRRYARLFISQCISKGCGDKLQIFSTDFIDGDFVDACVGLTHARIEGRI